jgi:hypothetical protein
MPVPVVTAISPALGPLRGGTQVTITGSGLTGATSVRIGNVEATRVAVNSDNSITATTAAGRALGKCCVTVTHAGGSSAANTLYTYVRDAFAFKCVIELYLTLNFFLT